MKIQDKTSNIIIGGFDLEKYSIDQNFTWIPVANTEIIINNHNNEGEDKATEVIKNKWKSYILRDKQFSYKILNESHF